MLKPGYYVHVPVTTDPPGATVSVNGYSAISPTTIWVPRGEGDFKLTITKKGYKPAYVFLRQSTDILLGWNIPLVGYYIDMQTGAAYDLEPEQVHYTLVPEEPLLTKQESLQ